MGSHTVPHHKMAKLGLRGRWENITDDTTARTWNSASYSDVGGMVCGVEIRHNHRHLGVMFPDGRWRCIRDGEGPYHDPSEEPYVFEKAGEKYAVYYYTKDGTVQSLAVFRALSGCCCKCGDGDFAYCPHCGGELP